MLSYLPTKTSLFLLAAALAGAHAAAAPDALHVYGGLGYGNDDNLLRVPDVLPGFGNELGDSWYQADAVVAALRAGRARRPGRASSPSRRPMRRLRR